MKCQCKAIHALYSLIFHRATKKNSWRSIIFHFSFAFALGIVFYYAVLVDLNFTWFVGVSLGLLISALMGIGAAVSSQVRCIILLTLPTFAGTAGRSVLKTLVVAFIISGPIENLASNGREVVRVFACTTSLTYNLTRTRFELMFKPFSEALLTLRGDFNEVKDTLQSIRDVSAPIVGEIEDDIEMRKMQEENDYIDDAMGDTPSRSEELAGKYETAGEASEAARFERKYLRKIEMRCEDQFSKASAKCRDMFAKGYDKCYEAVTWIAAWLLCWPMRLDFICNIAQALGGSSRCDPSKAIDPGLGEGYAYLKRSRQQFADNFKHVRLQYQLPKFRHLVDLRSTRDSAKAVIHAVREKKQYFDQIVMIFKRCLAFTFLKVIVESQRYHDRYLRDVRFDNVYVTPYFRRIDARRKASEKHHYLLPLKKIERKKLVDPCSKLPLRHERQQMLSQSLLLFIEMITATIFLLLDRIFYEGLDLVRRHAKIDYVQSGHHDLKLQITGTGLIANLLRKIVKGFNIKKRIYIERSNERCLPRPNTLHPYYLYKIYGTYLLIWLMMWTQVYTQRLRRVICSSFYERREKKRILFVYNETLKRRIGFFRFMRKKVQRLVREHQLEEDFNVLTVLRIRYPKVCNWLRICSVARRKCLICKEPESKSLKLVECPTEFCYYTFCEECWNDVGAKCVVCVITNEFHSSGVTSTSGHDDSDSSAFSD